MQNKKFVFMIAMVLVAILLCIILWLVAIMGSMNLNDGCFYRYNFDEKGNISNSDSITSSTTLKASANYTGNIVAGGGGLVLDPNSYGKWVNSNLRISPSQEIKLEIKGDVSLCKAYIPINNLQQDSDKDIEGNRIEIPRVEDQITPPVSLIFNAKTQNWKNLTELYRNDKYYVAIVKDQKNASSVTLYDYFKKINVTPADCREGKRTYDPICGRYSLWGGTDKYVKSCALTIDTTSSCSICGICNLRSVCSCSKILGSCPFWCGYNTVNDCCSCYQNVPSQAPEPYKSDGTYTSPWVSSIADLRSVEGHNCSTAAGRSYITDPKNKKYFWFSADNATGLLTRMDSNINPPNPANLGVLSLNNFSKIEADQSFYNNSNDYKIIKSGVYNDKDVGYLQYKIGDKDGADYNKHTGGYVLNIKQTKCRRSNGNGANDSMQGRGIVQYIIADYGTDPNTITNPVIGNIVVDSDGKGSIKVPANSNGYLWLKIKNDPKDYKDSFGQYTVSFFTNMTHGLFFDNILNPLFEGLKTKITNASITIFKNMTCYHGIGGAGNCTNFFNYIKGLLTLYIMFYGMMFLLGMVQISQTDLVIRVIKIAFVAGLMNNQTFEFFSQYVFGFVTHFSDNIIANMSGYTLASGGGAVSNPFMFMNEVLTKIFLSPAFAAQMMALLSMGINGVIYFIIMFVCIGMIIIVGLRAIAIYLMAYLAIAVLIGIAPLFLTFILFEKTRHLFENWVKFTFRYMLEPTIMLAGIIILWQLFTIYLDYVIGYSVCWKCAIPFKIPFPHIPGFDPAFLDVELFCFNWFAPWGFDHRSGVMGVNMSNLVILLILAYCMSGYIELSSKMVARLAGGAGGPSATGMGSEMSSWIGQKSLAKVGLDKNTRSEIKAAAKRRLISTQKGSEKSPLNVANRKDVDSESDSGSKKPDSTEKETVDTKEKDDVDSNKPDTGEGKPE